MSLTWCRHAGPCGRSCRLLSHGQPLLVISWHLWILPECMLMILQTQQCNHLKWQCVTTKYNQRLVTNPEYSWPLLISLSALLLQNVLWTLCDGAPESSIGWCSLVDLVCLGSSVDLTPQTSTHRGYVLVNIPIEHSQLDSNLDCASYNMPSYMSYHVFISPSTWLNPPVPRPYTDLQREIPITRITTTSSWNQLNWE